MRRCLRDFLTGFKVIGLIGLALGIIMLFIEAVKTNNWYIGIPTGIIIFASFCMAVGEIIENVPMQTCERDEEDN